ncbi:MAG: beta-N-acetylglucosaminidase [Candidatus Omnitrophota bacterium]|jgi:hexosaminidase|nr:MAG: beta-N-acetylglucosaminidase [Candidatus Omnitrophota bacterium]
MSNKIRFLSVRLCILFYVFNPISIGFPSEPIHTISSNIDELTTIVNHSFIIPKPLSIKPIDGALAVASITRIHIWDNADKLQSIANELAQTFFVHTGRALPVKIASPHENPMNSLLLSLSGSQESLGEEGYELLIRPHGIEFRAQKPAGIFYAMQTFRQLLQTENQESDRADRTIPCLEITDKPQFSWRGLLLDCARHFMTTEFIKRTIDQMAYHKLNVLHLHLTDDQGWRIEIKRCPELTEIGAWRGEGDERYGGFYTQDELKEIIAYAAGRFIQIIPEIEMPGHASAAIASYPQLSCSGTPIPVQTQWGIFDDVLCPGKESTFQFLEEVLEEVIAVFPSPFLHIGGDEAPRAHWQQCPHCQQRIREEHLENEHQLQSYLIRRIEKFLTSYNRRLIGWDEILEGGGLPAAAVVQSWRGMEGAVEASQMGHDVISSPCQFVYFDYPQTEEQAKSKPDWMMVTTLQKVYDFHPVPEGLTPAQAKHILGAECAIWSEHAPQAEVDRQLFPRLCAFCETVWSPADSRNWEDFSNRMRVHQIRLKNMNVDSY